MNRNSLSRRRFLRGALQTGTMVTVGLPFLEFFLNGNGDALASGQNLPRRFGTWFWGNGVTPEKWVPLEEGSEFELPPELEPLASLREHLTVLSGFDCRVGGRGNQVHYTGYMGTLTGETPISGQISALPTFDVMISDKIGGETRFRSLDMAATGNPAHSYSQRNQNSVNIPEPTALSLYQRVFGPSFAGTNTDDWKPSPELMLQKSVLSIAQEDRHRLENAVGAADRARLDQYFTSLREIESQLAIQLTRPTPLESCAVPEQPPESAMTSSLADVEENHRLMSQVVALALACDQARVFNMLFSPAGSDLYIPGGTANHHVLTHTEPRDQELGYQVECAGFVLRSMEAWAYFLETLAAIPEGDGSLLDNCLIVAHSEHSEASKHDVRGLPMMLAGSAGGKIKPGSHLRGNGSPVTRIGLTAQQLMGLEVNQFGIAENTTRDPLTDILI